MPQIGPIDWLEADRRERQATQAGLAGMYLAGPWLALPALISLPIMAVVGEGDYIIAVLGVLWAALLVGAVRVRRGSSNRTVRRACATWVVGWSAILSLSMIAMALTFAVDGEWH